MKHVESHETAIECWCDTVKQYELNIVLPSTTNMTPTKSGSLGYYIALVAARKQHLQEGRTSSHEDWMSQVEDNRLVSDLTIPGTHDSAAYTYNLPFITTQRMTIAQHLHAGIRYLDLRCGLRGDVLEMVHGPTLLGLKLADVLDILYNWLEKYPTEGLIVQLKKDRDDERSTIVFSQAVVSMIASQTERWRTTNTTPTMADIRGKIQLFRRFPGPSTKGLGVDVSGWQNNPLKPFTMHAGRGVRVTVQDHYRYMHPEPFPSLIEKKLAEIIEVSMMAKSNTDASHWYINYTSALELNWTYRYSPHDVAAGTWFGMKKVVGVDDALAEDLDISSQRSRYGILAMDFPESNKELVSKVIQTNFGVQNRATTAATTALVVLILIVLLVAQYHLYINSIPFW